MDFFEAQNAAQKQTRILLCQFCLCVVGVVLAVCLFTWWLVVFAGIGEGREQLIDWNEVNLQSLNVPWIILGKTALATLVLILTAVAAKTYTLREGGGVVARDLGGRLVDPSTSDRDERRLLNIVEEMAIASGVPVPQVYVLDEEKGINAFAAGTEPGNAAIGCTQGCLVELSRAELQGLIAHEFSHILNGDIRLNLRLIGWVFGLVSISMLGRLLFKGLKHARHSNTNSNGNAGGLFLVFIIGVALIVIGGVGVFFARLLQASISRQREFLADASAVQFTRDTSGIEGALRKAKRRNNIIVSPKAAEASHCFFVDGERFAYGLETHPPIQERIQRIVRNSSAQSGKKSTSTRQGSSSSLLKDIGNLSTPQRVNVLKTKDIFWEVKEEWLLATQTPSQAQLLVFALLLSRGGELEDSEISCLASSETSEDLSMVVEWKKGLKEIHSARKIALLDLVVSTLRRLSFEEYEHFIAKTRALIASDGKVDLFEFMLQRQLDYHLKIHFLPQPPKRVLYHSIEEVKGELEIIASTFAHLDSHPLEAFQSGMSEIGGQLQEQVAIDRIDDVLKKLESTSPLLKKKIVHVCAQITAHDNQLTSHEAELLRAMADGIGCVIPPFVDDLVKRT